MSRSPAMRTRPTRLARGEDVSIAREEAEEAAAEAAAAAEAFFEPEGGKALHSRGDEDSAPKNG